MRLSSMAWHGRFGRAAHEAQRNKRPPAGSRGRYRLPARGPPAAYPPVLRAAVPFPRSERDIESPTEKRPGVPGRVVCDRQYPLPRRVLPVEERQQCRPLQVEIPADGTVQFRVTGRPDVRPTLVIQPDEEPLIRPA